MTDEEETFDGETKSSKAILTAIRKAEDTFREWQTTCQVIDEIYSLEGDTLRSFVDGYDWRDSELDLFWSSFEVMKPAIYARPPQPVVSPLFKDGRPVNTTTAELLERCAISVFKRTNINDIMTPRYQYGMASLCWRIRNALSQSLMAQADIPQERGQ